MSNTSPLARKLLKGAFIRLDSASFLPIPQVIVFQYNPETLSRKFKPYEKPVDKESGSKPDPAAQAAPYDPEEEMDVVVEFDATDDLEEPLAHPVAMLTGVAARIAAMEMLLYPADAEGGLLSSAAASLAGAVLGALGASSTVAIPARRESPVILLVWGPGRIVPVKIASFTVEEQAFNPALYPIRAKVSVGVKVLTDDYFSSREEAEKRKLSAAEEMARSAYRYTLKQKRALSVANIASDVESILSMLPI